MYPEQVREAAEAVVEALNYVHGTGFAELIFNAGQISGIKVDRSKMVRSHDDFFRSGKA